MSLSIDDLLNEKRFAKYEREYFDKLSKILNQQYSIDSQKLDNLNLSEEDLSAIGRNSIDFHLLYDRLNTIEQMFVSLVVEHPSFLVDVQAYRLGMLSLGFMRVLLDYLIPEMEEGENSDEND